MGSPRTVAHRGRLKGRLRPSLRLSLPRGMWPELLALQKKLEIDYMHNVQICESYLNCTCTHTHKEKTKQNNNKINEPNKTSAETFWFLDCNLGIHHPAEESSVQMDPSGTP